MKNPVDVDAAASTITVPHWGITLRTLFGSALAAWPEGGPGESKQFDVHHKDTHIATITVRKHDQETT